MGRKFEQKRKAKWVKEKENLVKAQYQHYKMLLARAITGLDKELEVMHLDSSAQLLKLLTSQGPAIAIKGLNKFQVFHVNKFSSNIIYKLMTVRDRCTTTLWNLQNDKINNKTLQPSNENKLCTAIVLVYKFLFHHFTETFHLSSLLGLQERSKNIVAPMEMC